METSHKGSLEKEMFYSSLRRAVYEAGWHPNSVHLTQKRPLQDAQLSAPLAELAVSGWGQNAKSQEGFLRHFCGKFWVKGRDDPTVGVPSSVFLGKSKSQRSSEERHLSQRPREGRRPDLPPGCKAEAERGQG